MRRCLEAKPTLVRRRKRRRWGGLGSSRHSPTSPCAHPRHLGSWPGRCRCEVEVPQCSPKYTQRPLQSRDPGRVGPPCGGQPRQEAGATGRIPSSSLRWTVLPIHSRKRPASFAPRPRSSSETAWQQAGAGLCHFPRVTAGVTCDRCWSSKGRARLLPGRPRLAGTARGEDSFKCLVKNDWTNK